MNPNMFVLHHIEYQKHQSRVHAAHEVTLELHGMERCNHWPAVNISTSNSGVYLNRDTFVFIGLILSLASSPSPPLNTAPPRDILLQVPQEKGSLAFLPERRTDEIIDKKILRLATAG
jgi:hypothetical protein